MHTKEEMSGAVKVSFEASVEVRDGKKVVVVLKTTTTTPRSGRGLEYSKQSTSYETTVFPLNHVARFTEAITDALAWAVEGEVGERESKIELVRGYGDPKEVVGEFWTFYEAKEGAERFFADHPEAKRDEYTIRHAGDDPYGVIERCG